MDNPNESPGLSSPDSVEPTPKRFYPSWFGPVMAFFLPGSAHFLAGRRRAGILCWLAFFLFQLLLIVVAGMPGSAFFYVTVLLIAAFLLFYLAVLVSSWRPTRRIGCLGWLLFPVIILGLNYAVVLPCILLLKAYTTETFVISGASMSPTLLGLSESAPKVRRPDRVLVNKSIYHLTDPKRGDIVVYRTSNPADDSPTIWTHRIVGLPGETVDIESPHVLINGKKRTEPPVFEKIANRQDGFPGYYTAKEIGVEGIELPITLGPDEYFLMGDNSPRSRDSRFRGPVQRKNIVGQVIRIYYPFDRIREVE